MAGPNSSVQVNVPSTAGKRLATYAFTEGGELVESEAVTLTDGLGNEIEPATQDTLAALALTALSIDETLRVKSIEGILTAFTGSLVAQVLLVPDPLRTGYSIYNTSVRDSLYLLMATVGTVSLTYFTVRLQPNAYFEATFNYTGRVMGVWGTLEDVDTQAMVNAYSSG